MKLLIKGFERLVSFLTLALILIAGVFLLLRWQGYEPYVVMSSSMEPGIPTGSLLFTNTGDRDPEVGDVVTYWLSGPDGSRITVTHRVTEIRDAAYTVKGDNNDTEDLLPVTKDQVMGVYWKHIPKAGYLAARLMEKKTMIAIGAWVLLLNFASLVLGSVADRYLAEEAGEEEPGQERAEREPADSGTGNIPSVAPAGNTGNAGGLPEEAAPSAQEP